MAAYRLSLGPHLKRLSQKDLVDRYGLSKREAARAQCEVEAGLAAEANEAADPDVGDVPVWYGVNGRRPEGA